jgi:hypothetical protein
VQLGNVDNTADSAKPVSTATTAQLNLKANSADVFLKTATYSRVESEALFTYKIDTYTSPLRLVINPISFATDLRIDPLLDLSIANVTVTNSITCKSIKSPSAASGIEIRSVNNALLGKVFDSGQTQLYSTLDVTGDTTIGGNLTLTGYLAAKPFVSLRVTTGGGTPSTLNATTGVTTIGTPGAVVLVQNGFIQNVTVARGTAGASNAFLYTFSWTTAHPLGSNYAVMCQFQGSSTSNLSPNGFFRANGATNAITLWVRTSDGIIKDENFYVYTVP